MSDREGYFAEARGWAYDTRVQSARSRRFAWTAAGIAIGLAAFEAVALAMLAPLKTVQPVTLLVDRHTGYVQALDPMSPRRVSASSALTRSLLAQYVLAREGFDRATIATDYQRVALWSAGNPRRVYLATMPATNPASPFQRYPSGTVLRARVKSISRLGPSLALVRFDSQVQDASGRVDPPQPWVSVVRFQFIDAPMSFDDRLRNPLGFQVTGYRRDPEAPPPIEAPATPVAVSTTSIAPSSVSVMTTVRSTNAPASATQTTTTTTRRPSPTTTIPTAPGLYRPVERREVPISNVPMGSPLGPARPQP